MKISGPHRIKTHVDWLASLRRQS